MAVPTAEELFDYFAALTDRTNEPHAVFEWNYLNTMAFRHFNSKVAPIDRVMKELIEDGRLAKVRISNTGYVYLDHKELNYSTFTLHFQYHKPSRYAREDWGAITHKRSENHDNVWRSGTRFLVTTRPRYEAMLGDFLKVKEQHDEAKRQEQAEEAIRTAESLSAIAADATELLERLDEVIPGIETSVRSRSFADKENLYVTFNLRNAGEIGPFLDILRRGLPDVPRETKEGS